MTLLEEGLQGVYLDNHRRDSVNRQMQHFDIVHPEHGVIGTLSGGVQIVGAEQEYDPEGGWPIGRRKGGRRSFNVVSVGVDSSAVAKVKGLPDSTTLDKLAPQRANLLGPAVIRALAKDLKKRTRVTSVHTHQRISGVRKRQADGLGVAVAPVRIRESADDLIATCLEEGARPSASPEFRKTLGHFQAKCPRSGWKAFWSEHGDGRAEHLAYTKMVFSRKRNREYVSLTSGHSTVRGRG